MAHEAEKQELKQKISQLVTSKFSGDPQAAFVYYDLDNDGKLNRKELMDFLKDAGIGNWLTRGSWADEIIKTLDRDGDRAITMADLQSATA